MTTAPAALPVRVVEGRRNWASGRAPSDIERMAAMTGNAAATYPLYRVRSTVVDADVLIKEVFASVRRGYKVALLDLADRGALRLFAARSVVNEVSQKLDVASAEAKVSPQEARSLWNELEAMTRVIDVPPIVDAHELVRDINDAPTAYLSAVVGHRWTWSNDKDLGDADLATHYELQVALAIRDASAREREFHATVTVSAAAIEATAAGIRALWNLASRYPLVALLLGAGLALAAERVITRRSEIGVALHSRWEAGAPQRHMAAAHFRAYEVLIGTIPPAEGLDFELPLDIAVAWILAGAAVPLSTDEIRTVLAGHPQASEPAIRQALTSPLFVRTSVGRWQLGWW